MQQGAARSSSPVVIVTGAGTGIGRAVSLALLDAGFRVALAGRRREPLEALAAEHERACALPTDIRDPDAVDRLFAGVVARWGRVDVLFNNAGVLGPTARIDEVDLDAWNDCLDTNVTGAMLCAAAAFRTMAAQQPPGGRIINNGSIASQRPRPHTVAYTVAKHAITGLTRSIALDGRPLGITCGQIDIGNAATDLLDQLGDRRGALQPDGTRAVEPTFSVDDAARVVVMMAQLPPDATIGSVTITASGMPFDGRG